eukprot:395014-Amphidinium_carterae.1
MKGRGKIIVTRRPPPLSTRLDRNEPLPRPHYQPPCSGTTDDYYAYDQRHGNRSKRKGYSTTSTTTVLKLNYYVFGYCQDNTDKLVYIEYDTINDY